MAFDADHPLNPPSAVRWRRRPSRQRGAATTAGGAAPPPTARSRADAHPREREMVAFAKVWAPYGGGSDADIFVTFGLTPEQYFIRLATFLGSPPAGELTSAQRRTIRKVCDQRLAHTQNPTSRSSSSPSDSTGPR